MDTSPIVSTLMQAPKYIGRLRALHPCSFDNGLHALDALALVLHQLKQPFTFSLTVCHVNTQLCVLLCYHLISIHIRLLHKSSPGTPSAYDVGTEHYSRKYYYAHGEESGRGRLV